MRPVSRFVQVVGVVSVLWGSWFAVASIRFGPSLAYPLPSVPMPVAATVSTAVTSQDQPEVAPAPRLAWQPIFLGAEHRVLCRTSPRQISGHAVRIDLNTPGLRFLATPPNGDRPGQTDGLRTSTFLERYRCQLAINAAPFGPIHAVEGRPQTISGLTISDGVLVSPPHASYPALLITKKNEARLASPPFDLQGVHTAVGGFGIVLRQGQLLPGGPDLHPRTAVGLDPTGRSLILLVIDGRQPGFSLGVTTREVGQILQELGASEGLNLDGGGTTTLVREGPRLPEQAFGKALILNRPIHANIPGRERVSASHLGVYLPN